MRSLAMICVLSATSCTVSQWYPVTGSVIGAGAGSLAGPGAAAGASAIGYGIGRSAQLLDENEELAQTVDALTKGEIDALVAGKLKDGLKAGMESQTGVFAEMIDGIYDLLKLAALGLGVWFAMHVWHSGHLHIKLKKTEGEA